MIMVTKLLSDPITALYLTSLVAVLFHIFIRGRHDDNSNWRVYAYFGSLFVAVVTMGMAFMMALFAFIGR